MLQEVRGLNLGAFLITPIWAIGNGAWWLLFFSLIPYVSFGANLYALFKGNELAWRNRTWHDVDHFRSSQRGWAIAGVIITIIGIAFLLPVDTGSSGCLEASTFAEVTTAFEERLERRIFDFPRLRMYDSSRPA